MPALARLDPTATADADPVRRRRDLLSASANPRPGLDYLGRHRLALPAGGLAAGMPAPGTLTFRFVPDRLILDGAALSRYGAALASPAWPSPEALATAIFDDLNNELGPRWLNLRLDAGDGHRVVLEDRQPGWDTPHLLDRLEVW